MKITIKKIAEIINGEIEGDLNQIINGLSKINNADSGTLTFLANPQYKHFIYDTQASAVIVNKNFIADKDIKTTLIRVEDSYKSFSELLNFFKNTNINKSGIEKSAHISSTAKIGDNVFIGGLTYIGDNVEIGDNVKINPQCYIGDNVEIGNNTILYSNVNILYNSLIGNNCIIQSNAIIGSDGFGFAPNADGEYEKISQTGNVIIEEHVEIGANTTIDRATLGSTIIRKGVKLDNLIQIAHNVEVGENTVIAAQSGIAGSTKIGKNCMIGGQVGIIGHLTIADEVKIAAQSGIGRDIKNKGEIIQGSPGFNIGDYKRSYVLFKKLPNLYNRIQKIEKEL